MMSRNDDDDDENWFLEVFHPSQQQQQPSPYNNIPHKPLTANDGENRNHESSTAATITKTTVDNSLFDVAVSTTDAYVVTLQNPKECATTIKHLSKVLPLSSSLSHLKRVQRVKQQVDVAVSSVVSAAATVAAAEEEPSVDASNADAPVTVTNRQKKRQHVTTTARDGENDIPQPCNDSKSKRPKSSITPTNKNESISLKILLGTKIEIEQRFGPRSQWMNHNEVAILPSSTTIEESKQTQYNDDISILFTSCQYPNTVRATMEMVPVPRGMPRSEREWKHGNDTIWPTTYLPNQMEEYRIAQTILQHQLSSMERRQMKCGIQAAIQDASNFQQHSHHDSGGAPSTRWFRSSGVVIVHPHTGQILTTAHEEYTFQQQQQRNLHNCVVPPNPLMTPYIYAIQGISRIERQNMITVTNMAHGASNVQNHHDDNNITLEVPTNLDSNRGTHSSEEAPLILPPPQAQAQYLCTGYDVYATMEPNIYEAMALVHSRIRRLVFGCSMSDVEALANINSDQTRVNSYFGRHDSGILDTYVHALPSTNHHYRAFMCRPNSALWHRCCPYHNQHERSNEKS